MKRPSKTPDVDTFGRRLALDMREIRRARAYQDFHAAKRAAIPPAKTPHPLLSINKPKERAT